MRKAPVKYGARVTYEAVQGGAQDSGAQGSDHDAVHGRNCGRARVNDVVPNLVGSSDEDSDEDDDSATPLGPPPPRVLDQLSLLAP